MLQLFMLLVAVLALVGPAHATERLAVLELSGKAVPTDQLAALTDAVRGGVRDKLGNKVQVMTRENMEVMLTDMGLDASCVAEGACEVETARNLGVDYVVSGTITAFGPKLVASLKLHETSSGQLKGSQQATAEDAFTLLSSLPAAGSGVVGEIAGSEAQPTAPVQTTAPSPGQSSKWQPDFEGFEVTQELQSPTLGKLVCVSPGSFQTATMSRTVPGARGPRTTLTRSFCTMEHEVTQAAWEAMELKNRSKFDNCGANCPVENVTWFEAVAFANKISAAEGLEPAYEVDGTNVEWKSDANGYRLLTVAEWEVAARGREAFAYSGSDVATDVGWMVSNSRRQTHPVCEKKRNGYGLCDMSGNVWEWSWNWFGAADSDQATDPTGPNTGTKRLSPGGSWYNKENMTSPSAYMWYSPSARDGRLGFRLGRSL